MPNKVVMDSFSEEEIARLLDVLRRASGLEGGGIEGFGLPHGWDNIYRMYGEDLPPGMRLRNIREYKEMYRRMINSDGTGEGGNTLSDNQIAFRAVRDRLCDLDAGLVDNKLIDAGEPKMFQGKWKNSELELLFDLYSEVQPKSYSDRANWLVLQSKYNSNEIVMPSTVDKDKSVGKSRDAKDRRRTISNIISKVKDMRKKLDQYRARADAAKKTINACEEQMQLVPIEDFKKRRNARKRLKTAMNSYAAANGVYQISRKFILKSGDIPSLDSLPKLQPVTSKVKVEQAIQASSEEETKDSSGKSEKRKSNKRKRVTDSAILHQLTQMNELLIERNKRVDATAPPPWLTAVVKDVTLSLRSSQPQQVVQPQPSQPEKFGLDDLRLAQELRKLGQITEDQFSKVCNAYKKRVLSVIRTKQ